MSSQLSFDLRTIKEENPDFQSGDTYDIHGKKFPSADVSTDHQFIDSAQRFAGIGFEITSSIFGSLMSHPCIVLRRQCQVNMKACKYHLTPVTLLPVILRLQSRQGFKCFWKGSGGVFILRGCGIALETMIAEVTPFPREVSVNSSLKQLSQHLLLKMLSFGLLTPFCCANLVETVQSDIASDKPGVLDCLKEGIRRLIRWGTPQSTRLLPVWQLVIPTAVYGLSIYVLSSFIQSVCQWFIALKLQNHQRKKQTRIDCVQATSTCYFNNLIALHFGSMAANMIMFPAETILYRLYLQGTRTIIDDLDSGLSVLPVVTKYEGAMDCFHTIVAEEGTAGLYKGFGALIFEYTLHAAILSTLKFIFQEFELFFKSPSRKAST